MEFDVVVAGSGSAGLTAAIVAAHAGLQVLLVEKSSRFGGTSAWSGGGCWVPCNALMKDVGLADSRQAAETYLRAALGPQCRDDMVDAFLTEAPRMLDFMQAHTQLQFMARKPMPDARQDLPGALIGGRSLGTVPYDGRQLGVWLKSLSLPLNSFNAPGGMMMTPSDVGHAMQVFRAWPSFRHMAALVARHALNRLLYGRGTRLTMGNAMIARLLRSALDAGVTLWSDTPAVRLIRVGDRVAGLVVQRGGRWLDVHARRGVVLAAGGFSANPQWRSTHYPHAPLHQTLVAPGNTADGLQMAIDLGAVLESENVRNAAFDVVSVLSRADGTVKRCLHFFRDLPKPGCIAVNAQGERFGNEANLRLSSAMLATGAVPAWLVCDQSFIQKYGLGLVLPYGLNRHEMCRAGYLIQADDWVSLAAKLELPEDRLQATVARHNRFAETGVDEDFGRGATTLDRSLGDSEHRPNPCLKPIRRGPFYAVKLLIGDVGSVKGLRVDRHARPLDIHDRPIRGLYACGLDMNSLWSGHAVANGMNHAHNMTFAYIAARHLAAEVAA